MDREINKDCYDSEYEEFLGLQDTRFGAWVNSGFKRKKVRDAETKSGSASAQTGGEEVVEVDNFNYNYTIPAGSMPDVAPTYLIEEDFFEGVTTNVYQPIAASSDDVSVSKNGTITCTAGTISPQANNAGSNGGETNYLAWALVGVMGAAALYYLYQVYKNRKAHMSVKDAVVEPVTEVIEKL